MNTQAIRDIIDKIPIIPLLLLFMGYLGWTVYDFHTNAASPLNMKKQEITAANAEIDALKAKIKRVNDFSRTLELKKAELRALALELENAKGSLPENLNFAEVMQTLLTEAKRSGLSVTSLKPGRESKGESYGEQEFEFDSTGIYFQFVAFLDRIANLNKIMHVSMVKFTPSTAATAKYVQLKSSILFKAFRYIPSQADTLGKSPLENGSPKPASQPGGRSG